MSKENAMQVVNPAASAPVKASVINALAAKLECDPAKLMPMLKKTAFATCRTDEEFMAMCIVANTYGLNPILKEVYAFPSKGGQVVPIVGVDGWMKLMNSHPAFDGIEFDETEDGACTAVVYRKDRAHPIKVTEYLDECDQGTQPWKKWPRRMLRHKAMVQAARLAFGFAGIYDPDEGERIAQATAQRQAQQGDGQPKANTLEAAIARKAARTARVEPQEDGTGEDTPHATEAPVADPAAPQEVMDI